MSRPYIASDENLWRFVGGVFDLYADVPGDIVWQRPIRGRKADLLCTNRTQVTNRAVGKRTGQITIAIKPHAQQKTRANEIESMLEAVNTVFTISQPGETARTVRFDPDVAIEKRRSKGIIYYEFGLVEVGGAAPPVAEPELFPNEGAPQVYGAPISVEHSNSISVSWDNIPQPSINDIVFIQDAAIPGYNLARATLYTASTRNGHGTMWIPGDIVLGTYEIRLLLDDLTLIIGNQIEVT